MPEETQEVAVVVDVKLAQKMMAKTGSIMEIFPDDMKPSDVHENLLSSIAFLGKLQGVEGKAKTYIGRLLQIATANPEVYAPLGCVGFEEYVQFLKKATGFSRTNLYDSRTLMNAWSKLPVERIEAIGYTKLMIAAKYINQDQADHKKILKMAEEAESVDVFRAQIEHKQSDPGGTSGDKLVIVGSKADIKTLSEWLADEEVEAYLDTKKDAKKIIGAFEGIYADVQAAAKKAAKASKETAA